MDEALPEYGQDMLRDLDDVRLSGSMNDPHIIEIVVSIMAPHSRTKSWSPRKLQYTSINPGRCL